MRNFLLEFIDDEDDEFERHIYKDADTGKCYYFDGEQLVPVPEAELDDGRLSDEEEQRIRDIRTQEMSDEGSNQESPEEKQSRLNRIQNNLRNKSNDVKSETERKVVDSKRRLQQQKAKAKTIAARGSVRGAEQFAKCITDFLGNQINQWLRNSSWAAWNGKFYGKDIMMKGRKRFSKPKNSDDCPVINVYFDQSGSWGQEDIDMGNSMLRCLDQFEAKGLLEVKKYYFDTKVQDTPAGLGGGTLGSPVLDHIRLTKPDNVIVITDSDVDDCKSKVLVPGGVWFLWKRGLVSENFKEHLSGSKMTRYFMLGFV